MNTILQLPVIRWWPLAWRRSGLQRAPGTMPRRAEAQTLDAMRDLSARALADIGAPESLQARAQARRDVERDCRDALRLGGGAGDWSHW